jgi:cytidylate kinase
VSAPVVAIDGPSGSGKSTVARGVARRLGLPVLDTGAMYRAATLACLEAGVALDDSVACRAVVERAALDVGETTRLDGRDVGTEIRGPEVTAAVSVVAAHAAVREVLVGRQRAWVEAHGGGVVEGRDIGTVVFPHAVVKVYLTASDEERARRRHREEEDAARGVDVGEVREALARRDALDRGRGVSPLRAADDALRIDTTGRRVDDVVETVVLEFHEREGRR